jgi:hypothetical protein
MPVIRIIMHISIANHGSTVHQVRESEIYHDQSTLSNYWNETMREGMSNTTGRKWESRDVAKKID